MIVRSASWRFTAVGPKSSFATSAASADSASCTSSGGSLANVHGERVAYALTSKSLGRSKSGDFGLGAITASWMRSTRNERISLRRWHQPTTSHAPSRYTIAYGSSSRRDTIPVAAV